MPPVACLPCAQWKHTYEQMGCGPLEEHRELGAVEVREQDEGWQYWLDTQGRYNRVGELDEGALGRGSPVALGNVDWEIQNEPMRE